MCTRGGRKCLGRSPFLSPGVPEESISPKNCISFCHRQTTDKNHPVSTAMDLQFRSFGYFFVGITLASHQEKKGGFVPFPFLLLSFLLFPLFLFLPGETFSWPSSVGGTEGKKRWKKRGDCIGIGGGWADGGGGERPSYHCRRLSQTGAPHAYTMNPLPPPCSSCLSDL